MSESITAAEVTKVAEFFSGLGTGHQALAARLKREAKHLEAKEAPGLYATELAKRICDESYDWAGAYESGTDERKVRFDKYVSTVLDKLEVDGLLKARFPETPSEWATWQEVPEGVTYLSVGDFDPIRYVNRGGVRYIANGSDESGNSEQEMVRLAPFTTPDRRFG